MVPRLQGTFKKKILFLSEKFLMGVKVNSGT